MIRRCYLFVPGRDRLSSAFIISYGKMWETTGLEARSSLAELVGGDQLRRRKEESADDYGQHESGTIPY